MEKITVLIADDDKDDQSFAENAIREHCLKEDVDLEIYSVTDGESLLCFLRQEKQFKDAPRPTIIFLDLKMPKVGGIEALSVIKEEKSLKSIPIIILTTSKDQDDIEESYLNGANSYITKPGYYGDLKRIMEDMGHFWLESAKLPRGPKWKKK